VDTAVSGNGIITDSAGNVYVTGTKEMIGRRDAIIIKYDNNGIMQWGGQIGDIDKQTLGQGITIDSGGNIFFTGYTSTIFFS
jgi:hypothetical protein